MKLDIHPAYNKNVQVKCACGASYTIGTTRQAYSLDLCSACHPFYTGKQKLIDTAGRVDKFMARQKVAAQRKAEMADRDSKRVRVKTETVEEKIIRKIKAQEEAKMVEEALETEVAEEPVTVTSAEPIPVVVESKPVKKAAKK